MAQLVVQPTTMADYTLSNGLIRYKGRLVVGDDSALKDKILRALHCSPLGGHLRIRATYQKVKQLFFWPKQKADVMKFVMSCVVCQRC